MSRVSYYVSAEAAARLDTAVAEVMTALGGVPKHLALSALLTAAAEAVPQVVQELADERAAQLSAQLEQLRRR